MSPPLHLSLQGFKNGSPATKVIVFWKQSCPVRFLITALHLPGSSQDNSKAHV